MEDTHAFNLDSFPILDRVREWNIWMPSIMQLWLLLCRNVEGDLADVADLR